MNRAVLSRNKPALAVLIGMTLYAALLCWASYTKYTAYQYGDFDLAIDAQSMWSLLHGTTNSSIHGISFLGNHMRLILIPLAPLYAIWPSPQLLLIFQSLALAAGAWLVYLIARHELENEWAATLALIYLVYPPLILMNLYEFHPITFSIPLLLGSLLAYQRQRIIAFAVCLGLAMACQENVSLIGIGLAVYAFLDKRRGKWIFLPLAAGLLYLIVVVGIIMPKLNQGTIQFERLYAHFGPTLGRAFTTMISHPLRTVAYMFQPHKIAFLLALLTPLACLSLLSPLSLLPIVLVLAQRLLSARGAEASIMYHYQAEFIPFIFLGAIYGIRRALSLKHRIARPLVASLLVTMPIIAALTSNVGPTLKAALIPSSTAQEKTTTRNEIVARTSPDAAVAATFDFQPRLSYREHLYSLHHIYTGRYTLSDVPYPTPEIDTVIIHTFDPLTFSPAGFYGLRSHEHLQRLLKDPAWRIDFQRDHFIVLTKSTNGRKVDLLRQEPPPQHASRALLQFGEGNTRLLAFTLNSTGATTATLTLYWKRLTVAEMDRDVEIEISDGSRVVYAGRVAPGHRIWPSQSWPLNTPVADTHIVTLLRTTTAPSQRLRLTARLVPVGAPYPGDALIRLH